MVKENIMSEKSWEETLQDLGYMQKPNGEVARLGVSSVKYVGSGAYSDNGVDVKRKGQVIEVSDTLVQSLLDTRDDDGNVLFEAV